jgi:DNA mismatch repair protein MutS
MIGDYLSLHDMHTTEYGEKTVVLMQKGTFFNAFSTDTKGPDLKEISSLLNIQLTKVNKSIETTDEKNPYMLGFQTQSIRKFIRLFVEGGYAVPIYVERESGGMKKKTFVREKIGVITPSTYTSDMIDSLFPMVTGYEHMPVTEKEYSPYILALYVEGETVVAAAAIDMLTGKGSVWSTEASTVSFLHVYTPREVITNSVSFIKCGLPVKTILREVEVDGHDKIGYQKELLEKVYGKDPIISVIERLGLELYPELVTAWVFLLDHVYSLNPKILDRITIPEYVNGSETCRLENGAVEQLDLIGVVKVVDKTLTPMGKRYLKSALTRPLCQPEAINERIAATKEILDTKRGGEISDALRNAPDLERLHRRAVLGIITPAEVARIVGLCERCDMLPEFRASFLCRAPGFRECMDLICSMMVIIVGPNDPSDRLFVEGVFPDYDSVLKKKQDLLGVIQKVCERLHQIIVGDESGVKRNDTTVRIEFTERDGYHFVTTLKRSHALKHAGVMELIYHQESKSNNTVKIFLPTSDSTALLLRDHEAELKRLEARCWKRVCESLTEGDMLMAIAGWVARLDFARSSSVCVESMKYSLPRISSDGGSTVMVEGMRHPVIERLVRDEWPYVPHSLTLDGNGYLLYGVNSSGKSSIMKAMGVCVIMAQAGYAVPCSRMELVPYTAIFTRVSGSDDMYRGRSSGLVEMIELDRIIRYTDSSSLILGDEVCRGTESVSGCAIMAAVLEFLTRRKSGFIFATHLHELMSEKEITENPLVHVAHLCVDDNGNELVFHRNLLPGSGRAIYGAMVAKHVIRSTEFATLLDQFLQKDRLVVNKKSRYNSKKLVSECARCGSKERLETHHIIPQREADENGFIVGTALHKNSLCNLETLCDSCHTTHHSADGKN